MNLQDRINKGRTFDTLNVLFRSEKHARLLFLTPAKAQDQCIELSELFNNPSDKFTLHGNMFCTLVFESWKIKYGRVVRRNKMVLEMHFSVFF